MTKILRQTSPEIFDQIYSLANKQNMLSWQILFLGAVAACLLPVLPSQRSAAAELGTHPSAPVPCAGQECCCCCQLRVNTASPPALCHATQSWPAAGIFANKKYILSLVKRWVLYTEEMMQSLFKPARCFRILRTFFHYLKESCTVLSLQILLLSSFWQISAICKLAEVNTNTPLVFNWKCSEFSPVIPCFAVFMSVGFWRERHQNRRDKSPPRSVVEKTPESLKYTNSI